jgi:ribosomal protein S21
MSVETEREMTTEENGNKQEVSAPSAPKAPETSAPEVEGHPPMGERRIGFLTEAQYEVMATLGEEPTDYNRMMQSLWDDLQPSEGLESYLGEQIGETFWRMRRALRMRDGLALRNIQRKVQGEEMLASMQASKAYEAMEPFERLKEALSRRGQGPTAEEIQEFVKTRKGDTSEGMQEFIALLKSLNGPMEEAERKAARQQARKQLVRVMEPYVSLAYQYGRKLEKVQSPMNLAALTALDDERSKHLQRLEDSYLRRMWRLINAFGKVRQGILKKKDVKKGRAKPVCV